MGEALTAHPAAGSASGADHEVVFVIALDRDVEQIRQGVLDRFAGFSVNPRTLDEDPARSTWPSWARHGMLVDPHPPAETLTPADGSASYLALAIPAVVPEAVRETGHHRIDDFPVLHRPVSHVRGTGAGGAPLCGPGAPPHQECAAGGDQAQRRGHHVRSRHPGRARSWCSRVGGGAHRAESSRQLLADLPGDSRKHPNVARDPHHMSALFAGHRVGWSSSVVGGTRAGPVVTRWLS